ncbi:MAG: hypothetical protein PUB39_00400 [Eubacteriales bacterium]|nr:hypothetical protein [Eubacteriales bacterium]
MIKQHYTGTSRRALNFIWNAAGDYDFDSPFQAFYPNGDPDYYFNMVIGLIKKWLDLDRIADFFDDLAGSDRLAEASEIMWLGLENCVYEKEVAERPVMTYLRANRARDFYVYRSGLSKQQMMVMSVKVFNQEEYRWAKVLGKREPVLTPSEHALAKALEFPGDLDTDGVLRAMEAVLLDHFHVKPAKTMGGRKIYVKGAARVLAKLIMHREHRSTDMLVLRRGTGTGDRAGSVHLTHTPGELHMSKDPEKDREYIETAFGPCMYSDKEMRILENNLCDGADAGCRLWFSKSAGGGDTRTEEGRDLREDEARQKSRNEKFLQDHFFQIEENVKNLSAQIDTVFSSYLRYLPQQAKRGRLDPTKVYRIPVLNDDKVFLANSDVAEYTLTVDILLDASQSRMNSQEVIASQAYVIAKSFESCGIPVRVSCFRSLRGYTVIQQLKDYGAKDVRGVLSFYAGGWNRDGLCFRAMEYVMNNDRVSKDKKRLLLVLTDANPNDSVPLMPTEKEPKKREYEGMPAAEDTAEAVKTLRNGGIRTAAIFFGSTAHLENVHMIYGQEYVRIMHLNQLADAVASLLKMNLREMPIE